MRVNASPKSGGRVPMANSHVLTGATVVADQVTVRRIGFSDLKDALKQGVDDFNAMPTHAIFLCAIYPVIGIVLAQLAFGYSILPLVYPLASGFALIGPFAALGLYELSRRREMGQEVTPPAPFRAGGSAHRARARQRGRSGRSRWRADRPAAGSNSRRPTAPAQCR